MLIKNDSLTLDSSGATANDHSNDLSYNRQSSSPTAQRVEATDPHRLFKSVGQQFSHRQSVNKENTQQQQQHDDQGGPVNGANTGSPSSPSPDTAKCSPLAGSNSTEGRHLPTSQQDRKRIESSTLSNGPARTNGHAAEPGDFVTIIHFNDCYNIEPGPKSSGAAGFLTAVNQFRHLNPMILFSGDILSPSFMSTFTKGEQMIPVLNDIGVDCAVFGNHEFDYGVDNLIDFTKRTTFPWLLSNVIDKETSNQLGDGLVYHIIERQGLKFGLIGLIEEEWLSTLSTLDSSDVIYTDYVERGRELAHRLKGPEHGVDYVIALTHFRTPNDIRLADSVPEIDLILGGHDHDYEIIERPNCHIIKSGTDFREFSLIKLKLDAKYSSGDRQQKEQPLQQEAAAAAAANSEKPEEPVMAAVGANSPHSLTKPFVAMDIERVDCASYPPEERLKSKLDKFVTTIDEKMGQVLGQFNCELDGRFSSIRKYETNLGNFVTDIMLASTHADLAILNSGTLRSDRIHPKGDFTMRDLFNILGYIDPIAVLQASGHNIWKALENGVSQWPKLEGRFPQVSGCSFVFDPSRPPMERIDPKDIMIGEEPLVLDKHYKLTTKAYLASGKDGYDMLKDCAVLVPGDESPDLTTSILNHFEAISIIKSNRRTHHRQSIICLSRSSIKKILDQEPQNNNDDDSNATDSTTATTGSANDGNNNTDCAINEAREEEERGQRDICDARLHDMRGQDDGPLSTSASFDCPDGATPLIGDAISGGGGGLAFCSGVVKGQAVSPLVGSAALHHHQHHHDRHNERSPATPSAAAASNCLSPSLGLAPTKAARQPRTKRLMSLYEMETEQCKLEPKVEGRIKILGVNY